jgi:ABC-type sugar transport system ATPase subunit
MATPLLQIKHLSKTFPGLKALDDISIEVSAGEILALLGQNGSGKSTLVKVLAGIHKPDPGSEIDLAETAGDIAGLHFIHQDLGLVGMLSTVENLDLSRDHRLGGFGRARSRAEARRAKELIAGFGVDFDVQAPVEKLSAAERTIVAIARALEGWEHDNNVLVLDEPTASLHGDEVEKLFVAVQRVAARGAGVIFISHRLDEVVELADRAVVLRDGHLIAEVKRGGYDYDDLVRLIAGEVVETDPGAVTRTIGEPLVRARGVRGRTVAGVDLDLHAGEILGIAGVLGSGREALAGILFGSVPGTVESLQVGGAEVPGRTPEAAIDAGLAYVPADRHRQGAILTMSARENLTLPRLRPLRRGMARLDGRAERAEVRRWMEEVDVRPPETERPLGLFSGGNQQKVVLAKWLRIEPQVLLLDEPTQGVDVGAKVGIYELIFRAAAAGAAVLVCSSDDKELVSICDRVLVMRDGNVGAEMSRPELSEAALVRAGHGGAPAAPTEPPTPSERETPNHA